MRKYFVALLASAGVLAQSVSAFNIGVADEALVGDGIVRFVPEHFDITVTPELILSHEPSAIGVKPGKWALNPVYEITDRGAMAVIEIPAGTSLYGGGEVTGPLLRNGQKIKMWNTDTGMYLVDGGKRLYQTHPWVLGVRPDGSAFGVLFDTFHKAELLTADDRIEFVAEGTPFKTYVIDRNSPQEVMKGLAELTGTIEMPPLWSLGYHQCRFSYVPESRAREVAETFRKKQIPCDVIWFDINYMDGFRVFTVSKDEFPDPRRMNRFLHDNGFKSVYMIDPGVKVDDNYFVYSTGKANDVFVKDAYGKEFHGKVWPGDCAFPDFTRPETRKWWGELYKDFMANGIDGIWNDMNEPSVFDGPGGTMPESCMHQGGGNLPAGRHSMWHNAYGRLMVEASRDGILAVNPDKRPFLLSRSNILGGQRYAAMWTGDNEASYDHMKLSVPMSLTLGLSGQPFNGPDIGGFAGNTDGDLFGHWLGFGAFFPFSRGHASCDTNDKEPWAFGKEVERESRIALERRYRLMPYIYTAFRSAHTDGQPVMAPVFFADPADADLRAEEQAFLIGSDLLVVPAFAENPVLPKGIWEKLSLVKGDTKGKYQAELKVRGGSIIPAGKVVQNLNENPFEPLTLIVCPDARGNATGTMYWDEGDGWSFREGNYCKLNFTARRDGRNIIVTIDRAEGDYPLDLGRVNVEVLSGGKTYRASGSATSPIKVKI
ncbi:MAG: DUF5110 domain-containing protein [Muribaculaceae bacterium]|nr:DUF5110 domain-containing protein [Muribaculaceae bacterium]